jgi:hypothetical protein
MTEGFVHGLRWTTPDFTPHPFDYARDKPGPLPQKTESQFAPEPFDKLRANGQVKIRCLAIPFVVSLSNHERNPTQSTREEGTFADFTTK